MVTHHRLMALDARQKLFLALTVTFITCLVVGDIVGGKLVQTEIFGFSFTTTVGMVPFPVTFLLTDALHEFYGKRAARFVTLLGFGSALLAFAIIYVAAVIPISPLTREPGWTGVTESSFDNVFLGSLRMLIASLAAYLVSQFVDIFSFDYLKRISNNRFLWLRATGSTALSQLIDTVTITFVAWSGMISLSQIGNIIVSAYGLKLWIAVGLTPFVYLCHSLFMKGLGLRPIVLGADGEPLTSDATEPPAK